MASPEYKQIIVTMTAETLRLAQFKKKGANFSRAVNDVIHYISFQSSQSSTSTALKITLNVGVWVATLAENWEKAGILGSQWRERIGFLMPEHNDRWWIISSQREARIAASEINDAVKRYVLPKLETLSTIDSLVKLWRAGIAPGLTELTVKRYLAQLSPTQYIN
jgi:hypothetical protein